MQALSPHCQSFQPIVSRIQGKSGIRPMIVSLAWTAAPHFDSARRQDQKRDRPKAVLFSVGRIDSVRRISWRGVLPVSMSPSNSGPCAPRAWRACRISRFRSRISSSVFACGPFWCSCGFECLASERTMCCFQRGQCVVPEEDDVSCPSMTKTTGIARLPSCQNKARPARTGAPFLGRPL